MDSHRPDPDDAAIVLLGEDPADALIGSVESTVSDESVNHDHYLYGWPKDDTRP